MGIYIGRLVAGKTKVDILVTPFACIVSGAAIGLILGPVPSPWANRPFTLFSRKDNDRRGDVFRQCVIPDNPDAFFASRPVGFSHF